MMMVAVEKESGLFMYAGPVLSHHEFELIGAPRRMSDSEWKGFAGGYNGVGAAAPTEAQPAWRRAKGTYSPGWAPPLPPWTSSYLVPMPTP
jgi:hypothetical protein